MSEAIANFDIVSENMITQFRYDLKSVTIKYSIYGFF